MIRRIEAKMSSMDGSDANSGRFIGFPLSRCGGNHNQTLATLPRFAGPPLEFCYALGGKLLKVVPRSQLIHGTGGNFCV
jgi:hypothetical protein